MKLVIRLPRQLGIQPETLLAETQVPGLPADRIVRGVFKEGRIPATIARQRDVEQLLSLAFEGVIDPIHIHNLATPNSDGFMAAEDKAKLDELTDGASVDSIDDVPGLTVALEAKADQTSFDDLSGNVSLLALEQMTNTSNIAAIITALAAKADVNHSHAIADVTDLQDAINMLQSQLSILQSSSSSGTAQLMTYTISQSSVDSGHIGTYTKLTDGNLTTGAATGADSTSWIKADLGSEKLVWRVAVAGGNIGTGWTSVIAYLNGSYIEASIDNLVWTTLTQINGVTDTNSSIFAIPQLRARYIRIRKSSFLATTEFKIYGVP